MGQKYAGGPYVEHLDDVVAIIREFGIRGNDVAVVGYLHDVLEDTKVTWQDLQAMGFNEDVVAAVEFVTDEDGHNRKTRKAKTYERVRLEKQVDHPVVRLGLFAKWADRIANLRASHKDNPGLLKMYRKEAEVFREAYMPVGDMAQHFTAMIAEYDRLVAG